ncbi:GAF and ANTAR domain-containing protein [Streptomyces chrestomyceticus]|uniref:GAF and ANTAR domain-containing protein n=1 Tax=Streptomyces chrestomyceticus TaxID=68185 RepID=UPI0037BA0533
MDITESQARVAEAMRDLVHRTTDFDPLELLHDLTAHVAALLPVAGAGVTVLDELERVEYATASDERCRHLEQVQIELDEGPCLEATRTGLALPVSSLTGPPALRWPRFARNARRVGITAVAAVPLRSPAVTIGALNLMLSDQDSDTAPDGPQMRIAQALADATASCFGHRQEARDQASVTEQLTIALDSRLVIEQAKGVLSERLKVPVDEAFQRLRRHARARQQKLTALATEIAQGAIPTELAHS